MLRKISSRLSIGFFLLGASCASVPDPTGCVKLGPGRGYCTTAMSGKKQLVNDERKIKAPDGSEYTWFELEPRSIILPYWSWIEIKRFVIQNCKENPHPSCGEIANWQRTVDDIDNWLFESYK